MVRLKKLASVWLSILMLFSVWVMNAPSTVSASTGNEVLFQSDFSDSTGWVVDPHLTIGDGKLYAAGVEPYSLYRESATTTQSFSGTYTFSVEDTAPATGGHYNATRITWAIQNGSNYYELVIGHGNTSDNAANVTLKKVVDNVEIPLADNVLFSLGSFVKNTLQVIMESDGFISVNALQGYTVTPLYNRVEDHTFNSGAIAIGFQASPVEYDNFRVVSGIEELAAPELPPVPELPTMAEGNFMVQGSEILDPEGHKFIAKGVNVNGPRWPWSRPTLPDIGLITDNWNFNTVRVNMYPRMEHWNINNNLDLDGIIAAFTSRHVVTMIEDHDFTGFYPKENGEVIADGSYSMSVDELKAYWVDLAVKYKDNPYVWFNIMNEPGLGGLSNDDSTARWKDIHEEIIAAIRDAGAQNIIVLDGHNYGQEGGFRNGTSDSAILTYGPQLTAAYDNLVFSLHLYGEWFNGQSRLEQYLDEAAAKDLAVIIGEYGASTSQTMNVTAAMFNAAVGREVGRLVWAWEGEDEFDLTAGTTKGGGWEINKIDGSQPTNLSWFGSQVWADNHGTLTLPVTTDLPVLVNGNFEADMSDWMNWSNGAVAAGEGIDGSKAFKVAAGAAGGGGQFVTVKPDTTYKLTVWGKVSGTVDADGASAGFQYRPTETSPDSDQIKYILSFDSTSWTKKEVTFTTGPSVAGANVFIWKNTANVDLLIDNIVLAETNGDSEDDGGDDGEGTAPADIALSSAVFKDSSGTVVSTMPAHGMLYTDVTATNEGEQASAVLVVALYDANGDIAALSSVHRMLNAGETVQFTCGFNLPANTSGYTAKAMVWNNLQDMMPLADAVLLHD